MQYVPATYYFIIIGLISIVLRFLLTTHQSHHPDFYGGYVEPGFESVERAFRKNFETGYERDGAAFSVCYKGKMVVDIWGGYADKMALRLWKENTITTAFSCTKGVAALCMAQLVDRGYLDYDDLVTKYWPEFGANGKANITVKMLIGHEAGLAALDEPITKEAANNWSLMSKLFENQKPNWQPGTAAGYHVITFGWLVDQLVRRVDPKGRSVGQYFKEEIAEPFGIDFFIGLPRSELYRATRLTKPTIWDFIMRFDDWRFIWFLIKIGIHHLNPLTQKALRNPDWLHMMDHVYFAFNDPDIREMEIPAGGGIGTARALARLYCLLTDRTRPLLSQRTLDIISKPALYTPHDPVLGLSPRWGYGFMHRETPHGHIAFGHPGYGGQSAKVDLHEGLAYAYLRNNMAPEFAEELVRTFERLKVATYESVKNLKSAKS